jgi:hypothetical protein
MTKKLGRPKKTTVKTGALVPQPHGGAIRNGGPNSGGPGRPPSEIRAAMRQALDTEVLSSLGKKFIANEVDALGYANFLAKYGLGEKNELTVISPEIKAKIQTQVDIIGSRQSWDSQELLNQLSEVWK